MGRGITLASKGPSDNDLGRSIRAQLGHHSPCAPQLHSTTEFRTGEMKREAPETEAVA